MNRVQTAFIAVSTTFLFIFSLYTHFSPVVNISVTTLSFTSPPRLTSALLLHHHHQNSKPRHVSHPPPPSAALHRHVANPPPPSAVLLPDWQILLIFSPETAAGTLICLFPNNITSPATFTGTLTSFNLTAIKCELPKNLRRDPSPSPILMSSPEKSLSPVNFPAEMMRWNYLVYESIILKNEIVLFVKGINNRQGVNRPVNELNCLVNGVKTSVITAVQEVFRCQRPNNLTEFGGKITLQLHPQNQNMTHLVPSVAYYTPPKPAALYNHTDSYNPYNNKSLICACTMVYNSAKFLIEWVTYYSRIGVDKFVLYDNDSDDDLSEVVRGLIDKGFDVSVVFWVWPKTQEAGFSHCAVVYRDMCKWMVYVDVDEFVYSPRWVGEARPMKGMLGNMVERAGSGNVGQIMIGCYEFGPSDQIEHPVEGVTQGYNCRMREANRHKSIVLLNAVDESLHNLVHHFDLKPGYRSIQLRVEDAIVNHYKYQAWSEFKTKYRRRVSAYVVDWTRKANLRSKDRAPGLGVVAVEPNDWPKRFCEVHDNILRDLTRAWFGHKSLLQYHMAWQR